MSNQLPVIAIVGRPNVGKSTLFNRLIGQRKAIVGDRPGVTVDRLESECKLAGVSVTLVDTGGIGESQHGEMQDAIDAQVEAALAVADVVMFVVDGQVGATPVDANLADTLRKNSIPVMLVVNKAENPDVASDFYGLGLADPKAVSAAHGQGIKALAQELADTVSELTQGRDESSESEDELPVYASITVIGRPNVGKSTLINAWAGQDRMVVSPIAGTTRDAIDLMIPWGDEQIRLVDTAGQRKHGRIADVIEFVARVKAVQAFRRAQAAVLVLDGSEGVVEQDLRLMHLAEQEGCALLVAVNKVDQLDDDDWRYLQDRLLYRMRGVRDVKVYRIAAKYRKGTKALLKQAVAAAGRNSFQVGTGELNRWLEKVQEKHHAPGHSGATVRLKYASQIGTNPPTIKVFSNRPALIKETYLRYLKQDFCQHFNIPGVPVRFSFSASENPYATAAKAKEKPSAKHRGPAKKRVSRKKK